MTNKQVQEVPSSIRQVVEKEATDAIQQNSITILITLFTFSALLYWLASNKVLPRVDKAIDAFKLYLEQSRRDITSIDSTTKEIEKDLTEYTNSIQQRIIQLESRIDANKEELTKLRITLASRGDIKE